MTTLKNMTRSCDLHGAETNTCQDTWALSVWGQMKTQRIFHSVFNKNKKWLNHFNYCTPLHFPPVPPHFPGIGTAKCQQCCRCLDVIWAPSLRLRSVAAQWRNFAVATPRLRTSSDLSSPKYDPSPAYMRLYHRFTGANKLIIQFMISARQDLLGRGRPRPRS